MKKILICYSSIPFIHGGAEQLINGLHREILKTKCKVEVIQVPFKWYPVERLISEIMIWRLMDLSEVDGNKVDMVISTKFPSTAVKHNNKIIWMIHQHRYLYDFYGTEYSEFNDSKEHKELRNILVNIDTKTLKESQKIYTISKNVSKRLSRYNKISSDHLYPPIDNPGSYYCDDYGNYIIFVGRLKLIKRAHLLVEAFKYVKTNAKCFVIGQGCEYENLMKIINLNNLQDKVKLMGFLDDTSLRKYYADAFAVFNAPYDEDYGYVTHEAFLSKKPVITTFDSGGVLEFVSNEENGFVCNPSPSEIAEKIDLLYSSKKLCKKYGENGYAISKKINWDFVIKKLFG